MKHERGFALLAALWLVAALTALTATGITAARIGSLTTRNRTLLARAAWARNACSQILLARYATDSLFRNVAPVDLGRGAWCRAGLEDPSAKLNANVATREALVAVISETRGTGLGADSLAARLIAARRPVPLSDLRQLLDVPGFDSVLVDRLQGMLTVRGSGVVNVLVASPEVLRTLPGFGEEAVRTVLAHRTGLARPRSLDDLVGLLTEPGRASLLAHFADLAQAVVFTPGQLIAMVEGGVNGTGIIARGIVTMVPVPGRLVIIRQELE